MLCHAFRRGALPEFFATTRPGPRDQPRKSAAQEQIVALRKRNYSIYDISRALKQQGTPLSATAVREVLATQGFAPLPRRLDEERPVLVGPSTEAVADVRSFTLAPREFTTRMGGLFLFVPDLVHVELEALALGAKLPGSRMIPAAMRCAPRWLSSCGPSNARATSWPWWPTRGSLVLRSQCDAEEELPGRVFFADHPAQGRSPARPVA